MKKSKARRGFTLLELMIAALISVMLVTSMTATLIYSGRILKGNFTQQQAVAEAKSATEAIASAIRQAAQPVYVVNAQTGAPAVQGNRIDFGNVGEAATRRRITLTPGADNNYMTPQDNILTIDPDTTVVGGTPAQREQTFRWFSPVVAAGAFTFANGALTVSMRRGDPAADPAAPLTADQKATIEAMTGKGTQGIEVNLRFSPRNTN